MMNGPFSRNYTKQQQSPNFQSVPVQQTQRRSSPKVVSVPIHFVSSDQPRTTMSMLKESAAIKIQKVFRGFVVRKSVKKIASIRNEVSEIERRIDDIEAVNLIRRDAKERLRVIESLMSLLLKLDSIRGVDSGVRDLRKSVTRKAIALQEKVDSISQLDHQTLDSPDHDSGEIEHEDNVCTTALEQVTVASDSLDETVNNDANLEAIEDEIGANEVVKNCNPVMAEDETGEVEAMEASPAVNLTEIGEKYDTTSDVKKHKEGNHANYDKENREILENLMDDNEKMMKLMTQISERNEMQTRMINSLSRRVEQLEKALTTRKKKKTQESLRRRKRDVDSFCI